MQPLDVAITRDRKARHWDLPGFYSFWEDRRGTKPFKKEVKILCASNILASAKYGNSLEKVKNTHFFRHSKVPKTAFYSLQMVFFLQKIMS